ncbi:MAG: Ca2+/Na+ antiporter [Osedax symbiont Rs1]|nr:MAG: Ca2+/Na+ antiporter [Osedax symbiont Rs1]
MLYPIISLVIGLIVLVWSADKFVFGAASTAKNFGMSPLLIGLTIVSFGTSAPEILVSIMATLDDVGTLAIGNAIGSNIANIALVLGATALIAPLPVINTVRYKEMPLMLGVTILAGALLFNLRLDMLDSIILFIALIISLIIFSRTQSDSLSNEEEDIAKISTTKSIIWLVLGLILLVASSKALVWGATEIAVSLGVSDLIIGLTIVAIGTSLPELAASITSALKGHHDIAIGNIIGSNIFNLGAVMAIPGLAAPILLESEVFNRDFLLMLALSLLLLAFCFLRKPASIKRPEGAILIAIYVIYMLVLYITSTA